MNRPVQGYIDDALRAAKLKSGVPLTFAGTLDETARCLRLSHFSGRTVGALNGLVVASGHGLGGRVMGGARAMIVENYLQAPHITHTYDRAISLEGLSAMVAVPVIVKRRTVAVLYSAVHGDDRLGPRAVDVLSLEVRSLEQRIAAAQASIEQFENQLPQVELRDRMTAACARLNSIARQLDDQALRDQLMHVTDLLLEDSRADPDEPTPCLTTREVDVLVLAAMGYTNARIGESLGIKAQTAKGYMKDLMKKLGVSSRMEAVIAARRHGLLP